MELDQVKFMNLVMEKTNRKLNELQSQVIVLESQLQLAAEMYEALVKEVEKQKTKEKN